MTSPLTLIGRAWQFYREQPVLNAVAFWLLFVPVTVVDLITDLTPVSTAFAQADMVFNRDIAITGMDLVFIIPVALVLLYFFFWGHACVLSVAKRMVSSPAGRKRSSFKAVRTEGHRFVLPLFTTEIIRSAITLLWALLLIIPGIIYNVRTVFYDIIMISDSKYYGRAALARSKELTKGRVWSIFWRALVFFLLVIAPASVTGTLIAEGLIAADPRLLAVSSLIQNALDAYAGMLFTLCLVALYADLVAATPAAKPVTATTPTT